MLPKPIFHPPPPDEIRGRIGRVRAMMEEQNLTYYVAFSPDKVPYLTNFANYVHERPFILVVPRSGSPQFLVPKLEIPHVRTRAVGDLDLVACFSFPPRQAILGSTALPRFLRTDIIDDVRMFKSDYESGADFQEIVLICNSPEPVGAPLPTLTTTFASDKTRTHERLPAIADDRTRSVLRPISTQR